MHWSEIYDLTVFLEPSCPSSLGALRFSATRELLLVPSVGVFFCAFGAVFFVSCIIVSISFLDEKNNT
jgi:hypothetical protein